ncbi:AzlD domain-containing protein [Pararhodospirillum photometricum]|uniref:Branched-chain amino acid transport n=1 Tax=Pararhodospirillum photometricum DSM 122 TaxID=1150469 RepID=H6SLF9_PARPM|nr:AzlD domain-containing protein [Pararhodospirillum photometricum]CCG08824.1 unnamed protein product [Pararhodospirillum photometricum DSM 122]
MNDAGSLLLAIGVIGLTTYGTRVLPFLLGARGDALSRWIEGSPVLKALGPSLIAALAAVTVGPDAVKAIEAGRLLPYGVGAAVTVGVLIWRKDLGTAVLAGIVAYGGVFAVVGG